jgi:hypothetical protein
MRADMTPEQVRAAGIYLNGGRRRGWKQRLAGLLDTPQATISAWSTRSPGNARPLPGVAAVAIKLLVAMMRQELMVTARADQAGEAMAERLVALLAQPQPSAVDERPITVESLGRPAASVQRAPLLGIKRSRPRPEELIEPRPASATDHDRPEAPIPLGRPPRPRTGGPRSSA